MKRTIDNLTEKERNKINDAETQLKNDPKGNHSTRLIEKLAAEQFNGNIPDAIEYAYRTWGSESNERMDKIYAELTVEEKRIAMAVIKKMVEEKHGKNALDYPAKLSRLLTSLNMTEKDVLNADANPFAKSAKKFLFLLLAVTLIPLFLAYLLKDSKIMLWGSYYELKKILFYLPVIGITPLAVQLGPLSLKYFDFRQAKKILSAIEKGGNLPKLLPRISVLGSALLFLAIVTFFLLGINEANTLKGYLNNGVPITAICYDIEETPYHNYDDEDYYAYYEYEYAGKTYTYKDRVSHNIIGKSIDAYIYPDNPEQFYCDEPTFFPAFLFFMIAAFFFWMENGYPKHGYSAFMVFEGLLMITVGSIYNINSWFGWGIFFVLLSLTVIFIGTFRKKRNSKKQ